MAASGILPARRSAATTNAESRFPSAKEERLLYREAQLV